MESLETYLRRSEQFPGWTRGAEAKALAQRAFECPDEGIIVEIGSFFGSGSVLLAGARKLRGSGRVHCVDPFDASGDAVSVPHYRAILMAFSGRTQRQWFDENLRAADVSDWVTVHQGTAVDVAAGWNTPIDLLFLDGDQSPAGARAAYEAWFPWLKPGGILALHNSEERDYEPDHDGHYRVAQEFLHAPVYTDIEGVASITFARKAAVVGSHGV